MKTILKMRTTSNRKTIKKLRTIPKMKRAPKKGAKVSKKLLCINHGGIKFKDIRLIKFLKSDTPYCFVYMSAL